MILGTLAISYIRAYLEWVRDRDDTPLPLSAAAAAAAAAAEVVELALERRELPTQPGSTDSPDGEASFGRLSW